MTAAAQTLNVLTSDDWVPVVVGLSMVTLGTGVAALRSARTTTVAGLGVRSVSASWPSPARSAGVAFLVTPVWTLVTGIVLFRSSTPHQVEDEAAVNATASVSSDA